MVKVVRNYGFDSDRNCDIKLIIEEYKFINLWGCIGNWENLGWLRIMEDKIFVCKCC